MRRALVRGNTLSELNKLHKLPTRTGRTGRSKRQVSRVVRIALYTSAYAAKDGDEPRATKTLPNQATPTMRAQKHGFATPGTCRNTN